MNYRHAFHAGNFADVFKHTILVGLVDALKTKPGAFCVLDTHAGRGSYDLSSEEAQRTGEFREGVARLMFGDIQPPLLQRYIDEVRRCDDSTPLKRYPGSPLLVSLMLREQDRGVFCELQPEEAAALKQALRGDARSAAHQRDGYAAMKAFLPPPERRGLVLIDPPFEAQDGEFRIIESALDTALQRWPTGLYAIWYPIKRRSGVMPFQRWLSRCGAKSVLNAELMIHPDTSPLRLNGCGMAIINPPWQFDAQLVQTLPTLTQWLAPDKSGSWRCDWLVEG